MKPRRSQGRGYRDVTHKPCFCRPAPSLTCVPSRWFVGLTGCHLPPPPYLYHGARDRGGSYSPATSPVPSPEPEAWWLPSRSLLAGETENDSTRRKVALCPPALPACGYLVRPPACSLGAMTADRPALCDSRSLPFVFFPITCRNDALLKPKVLTFHTEIIRLEN